MKKSFIIVMKTLLVIAGFLYSNGFEMIIITSPLILIFSPLFQYFDKVLDSLKPCLDTAR